MEITCAPNKLRLISVENTDVLLGSSPSTVDALAAAKTLSVQFQGSQPSVLQVVVSLIWGSNGQKLKNWGTCDSEFKTAVVLQDKHYF